MGPSAVAVAERADAGAVAGGRPSPVAGATPVVAIRDLHVRYGAVEAVRGITLEVMPGETFGLLGPNGAGKTSTLGCLEGLVRPAAGSVHVFGLDVAREARAVKARVGVSLQSAALFEQLTLLELLEFYAAAYDRFPPRAALLQLLARFGLEDKARARAKHLSGGQQQRLALAIALVNDPPLVVLDEPTAGLDPQARRTVWDVVGQLRDEGRTVLLTTHYMEEAAALCGRVAILDRGRVLALDSPTALIQSLGERATIVATVELPAADVERLPGVLAARYAGERLEIATSDAPATSAALHALAAARGRALRDLTIRHPNLEDVFISLTGRTIRP